MIRVSILCNQCGVLGDIRRNERDAILLMRRAMKKQGWTHTHGSVNDYCEKCSKARAEKKNARTVS